MESFWKKCLGIFSGPLNLKGQNASVPEDGMAVSSKRDLASGRDDQLPQKQQRAAMSGKRDVSSEARPFNENETSLIEPLIRSIASVSEELKRLRHTIEKGNGAGRGSEKKNPLPAPIRLDLEGFLERKLKDSKETKHG
jgi:hypothetical protein